MEALRYVKRRSGILWLGLRGGKAMEDENEEFRNEAKAFGHKASIVGIVLAALLLLLIFGTASPIGQ